MFSQVLNLLPSVNISSFQKTVERLNEVYSEAANDSMSQAACEVKENMTNPTDIVDTRVAIDGTWQKRGKSSLRMSRSEKNMNIEKASKTDNNNELLSIQESKSEDPKETVQDATDYATRLLNQFTNDTKKCYTCSNCTDGVISKCTRTNDTVCRRRGKDNKGVVGSGVMWKINRNRRDQRNRESDPSTASEARYLDERRSAKNQKPSQERRPLTKKRKQHVQLFEIDHFSK
eukprot:gene10471-11568_t